MRWIALLLILCSQLAVYAQSTSKIVEYDVQINDQTDGSYNWFKDNVNREYRIQWLEKLFAGIEREEVPIYDANDISKPLTSSFVTNYLYAFDTAYTVDPVAYNEVIKTCKYYFGVGKIKFIRFKEEWQYLPNGNISKKVLAIAPVHAAGAYDKFPSGPLFWVKNPIEINEAMLIAETIQYNVFVDDINDPILLAVGLDYPDLIGWYYQLRKLILNDNSLALVDLYSSLTLTPVEEVPFDTTGVPNFNYVESYLNSLLGFDKWDLAGITFREEWSWVPNEGLVKKIIAIAPLVRSRSEDAYEKYYQPFWVKF